MVRVRLMLKLRRDPSESLRRCWRSKSSVAIHVNVYVTFYFSRWQQQSEVLALNRVGA